MNIFEVDLNDIEIEDISENETNETIEERKPREKEKENENQYLELANDCKLRIQKKNEIIGDLQKKIICLYAFIKRYMETDEPAFIEEAKLMLDEALTDDIGIQSID